MSSLRSRYPSQSDFLGSSTSANLRDRSFAPPGRRRIAESPDVNTATNPLGFAADPSSHVLGVSIDAANNSNGASNDSEATSAPSSSTHTQANDSMIDNDNAAGQHFLAAKFIPFEMMPNNAPSPQTAYTHPPATNMNQPTGYGSSFHNPQSFHSTHRKTVIRSNIMPSSSLHVPYLRYHIPPNTGPAPSSSYPRSFAHDSGAQHGSLPAGPPDQPAPPMAPSQPIHRNPPSPPSSGRHRRTQTQKTYPLPSKIRCYWLDEDNTPCPFKGSFDDLKKHFKNSHLSGAQNSLGRCRWQDCQYQKRADPTVHDMRRDCVWRHVREKHLKIKRV
ncbi:hypothetical protein BDR07DRAFT_1031161 [Suillus spraguei]|nr:hypothetical protein BDR07DRAFT_1031161 [Suillus spraguei]